MIDFNTRQTKKTGFTIIELLVVIVVIGILASIVLVAYPGSQARNRDTKRKSDIQQVATALSAYALQKNNYVEGGSGCGVNGNGNGWLSAGSSDAGAGSYPRSITQCLQDAQVLATGNFIDPSNCTWNSAASCGVYQSVPVTAYMKATCTISGTKVTYVLGYLETQPQIASQIDALCDSGSLTGFDATGQKWGTNYGMNFYVRVK